MVGSLPRLAFLALLASAATAATASLVFGCAEDGGADTPSTDAGADTRTSGSRDGEDAGTSKLDGAADAKPGKDANGPGATDDDCVFNRDCQLALRCECDESTGCSCQPGARGTGQNGIDACDSGDQCTSSLCMDGPTPGESICSNECANETECTGKLPRCVPVAGFPSSICVREPPK